MSEDPGETLWGWLERASRFSDTGIRLLDRRESERWLPWREVFERARNTGTRLRYLGARPGDRVALVFPTGTDFFSALFGVLAAGAIPAPLYPPARLGGLSEYRDRTAAMLRAAGACLVLADDRLHRVLGEAAAEAEPRLGCLRLGDLPSPDRPPKRPETPSPDSDDLALVQFSSGTTVAPKPVALSHRAVTTQARLLNRFWPDSPETTHSGVSWLPLYHDMGLIGSVFTALERPGILTLLSPGTFLARPALWLRAISRYRATVSPAPDFGYRLCVERIRDEELEGADLSSWTVALDGAEAVSADLLRTFAERFEPWGFRRRALTPVYGLSEASLAVTFSPPGEAWRSRILDRRTLAERRRAEPAEQGREIVSVGRPLPGFEVEIRSGRGRHLPEDRVGRIWVRGPSLMEGYLDRPELTAEHLVGGWLDTGDLGFLHGGELYVTGRAKDVVVVRGRNFDPQEIEAAVRDLPGARSGSAVAVSRRARRGGEELLLFLEHARKAPPETRSNLSEAAATAVRERIGISPATVEVLAPGSLPRTSSGKLRRGETLARWETGLLSSASEAGLPRGEARRPASPAPPPDGTGP